MTIAAFPSAIIFVNPEFPDSVKNILVRQLYIDEVISGDEFDARFVIEPDYVNTTHANDRRILVMRDLHDLNNRLEADIVLMFKNGMISVELNKFGPPGASFRADRIYLSELIFAP